MIKSILIRFAKGILAGAISAMILVPLVMPTSWHGFKEIFNNLGIAACFGSITGLILAVQKWASWKD